MTHRVTVNLVGNNSSNPTFDITNSQQSQCKDIFNTYINNGWIENMNTSIIDDTTKQEVIDFDSDGRWIAYRSELQAITGDSDITEFTSTIVSAVDV